MHHWPDAPPSILQLEPEWSKAATVLKKNKPAIQLAKVDATDKANEDLSKKYGIKGFPTIKVRVFVLACMCIARGRLSAPCECMYGRLCTRLATHRPDSQAGPTSPRRLLSLNATVVIRSLPPNLNERNGRAFPFATPPPPADVQEQPRGGPDGLRGPPREGRHRRLPQEAGRAG
jgi:hypothetical protein